MFSKFFAKLVLEKFELLDEKNMYLVTLRYFLVFFFELLGDYAVKKAVKEYLDDNKTFSNSINA